MREVTVRLRFTKDCLGNVKRYVIDPRTGSKWPVFFLPRMPDGRVRFEANWWKSGIRFAAEVLCRHYKAVEKIHFDIAVEGTPHPVNGFYKRYFDARRYVKHEAFIDGDVISINCIVPSEISDDDFKSLMDLVGRFKGISPFGPREYGFFTVESVIKKSGQVHEANDLQGRPITSDPSDATNSTVVASQCSPIPSETSPDDKARA
jgi:hypothetical protein